MYYFISFLLLSVFIFSQDTIDNPFERSNLQATKGAPVIYGTLKAGCISGAIQLDSNDPCYMLAFPHRQRHFGHPRVIAGIKRWSNYSCKEFGKFLQIGDIGAARGGPIIGVHKTHQAGVDADIRFRMFPKEIRNQPEKIDRLKPEEFVDVSPTSPRAKLVYSQRGAFLYELTNDTVNKNWSDDMGQLVRRIASDPEVYRVLVNPIIKRKLCEYAGYGKKPVDEIKWLKSVRIDAGHNSHFHVTVQSAPDSKDYTYPKDYPDKDGLGCDLLMKWQSDKPYVWHPYLDADKEVKTDLENQARWLQCQRFPDAPACKKKSTAGGGATKKQKVKTCISKKVKGYAFTNSGRDEDIAYEVCLPKECWDLVEQEDTATTGVGDRKATSQQ